MRSRKPAKRRMAAGVTMFFRGTCTVILRLPCQVGLRDRSTDVQDATGFFVAGFQIDSDAQVHVQPEGQRRQRLSDRHGIVPKVQQRPPAVSLAPRTVAA